MGVREASRVLVGLLAWAATATAAGRGAAPAFDMDTDALQRLRNGWVTHGGACGLRQAWSIRVTGKDSKSVPSRDGPVAYLTYRGVGSGFEEGRCRTAGARVWEISVAYVKPPRRPWQRSELSFEQRLVAGDALAEVARVLAAATSTATVSGRAREPVRNAPLDRGMAHLRCGARDFSARVRGGAFHIAAKRPGRGGWVGCALTLEGPELDSVDRVAVALDASSAKVDGGELRAAHQPPDGASIVDGASYRPAGLPMESCPVSTRTSSGGTSMSMWGIARNGQETDRMRYAYRVSQLERDKVPALPEVRPGALLALPSTIVSAESVLDVPAYRSDDGEEATDADTLVGIEKFTRGGQMKTSMHVHDPLPLTVRHRGRSHVYVELGAAPWLRPGPNSIALLADKGEGKCAGGQLIRLVLPGAPPPPPAPAQPPDAATPPPAAPADASIDQAPPTSP